jgi:gamma-glutamylcyclotransferase (GGCT)/AIG2-like uncharacterized protein YtfP
MNNTEYIFVYGSLMSNHTNKYAKFLRKNSAFISNAFCFGYLKQIDWYSGLILSNKTTEIVHGELYSFTPNQAFFKTLDTYEDIDSGEYIRKKIIVYTNNIEYECWTYIYNK